MVALPFTHGQAPDARLPFPKGRTMKENSSPALAVAGLTLGHVRTVADVQTMQRHGLASAGNVLNFATAPRRRPLPPLRRGPVNGNTPGTPAAAALQVAA